MSKTSTASTAKYKIGQLVETFGSYGLITGVMNRGEGASVYEVKGQESLVAEGNIDSAWTPVILAKPRTAKKATAKKVQKVTPTTEVTAEMQ